MRNPVPVFAQTFGLITVFLWISLASEMSHSKEVEIDLAKFPFRFFATAASDRDKLSADELDRVIRAQARQVCGRVGGVDASEVTYSTEVVRTEKVLNPSMFLNHPDFDYSRLTEYSTCNENPCIVLAGKVKCIQQDHDLQAQAVQSCPKSNRASNPVPKSMPEIQEAAEKTLLLDPPEEFRLALSNMGMTPKLFSEFQRNALEFLEAKKEHLGSEVDDIPIFQLNALEYLALKIYTTPVPEFFAAVNSALRKGDQLAQKLKGYTEVLNEALKKLPKFDRATTRIIPEWSEPGGKAKSLTGNIVIRHTALPDTVLANAVVGSVYQDKAYMSATNLKWGTDAHKDYPHCLVIQSKTGRTISNFSDLAREDEILFLPGTRFEIVNRYKISESAKDPDDGSKQHPLAGQEVIVMIEIGDQQPRSHLESELHESASKTPVEIQQVHTDFQTYKAKYESASAEEGRLTANYQALGQQRDQLLKEMKANEVISDPQRLQALKVKLAQNARNMTSTDTDLQSLRKKIQLYNKKMKDYEKLLPSQPGVTYRPLSPAQMAQMEKYQQWKVKFDSSTLQYEEVSGHIRDLEKENSKLARRRFKLMIEQKKQGTSLSRWKEIKQELAEIEKEVEEYYEARAPLLQQQEQYYREQGQYNKFMWEAMKGVMTGQ